MRLDASGIAEFAGAEGVGRRDAKLKKLPAEAVLDNAMLKDVASKKW